MSDPSRWEIAIKNSKTTKRKRSSQRGGGLSGLYKRKRFRMPHKAPTTEDPQVEQVSPTVAIEERAESELEEQKKDDQPYVKGTAIAGIKGRKTKKGNSRKKTVRPQTRKAKTNIKRQTPSRRKRITSKKSKNTLYTGPSVFDRLKKGK